MVWRQRLGVQDALWLEMDRPTNLMVVDSVWWTASPIDWDRYLAVVRERIWDRYPVFRSVAVRSDDGSWWWEEQPGADLDAHVERVALPEPGDDAALQDLIASQRSVPLDRHKPLWRLFTVDGFNGGSAVVLRSHHAIADGIRMVQLGMSVFDATPEGGPVLAPPVNQHNALPRPPNRPLRQEVTAGMASAAREIGAVTGAVIHRVNNAASDPVGATTRRLGAFGGPLARRAAGAVATSLEIGRLAFTNPVGAAHSGVAHEAVAVGSATASVRSSLRRMPPRRGHDVVSAVPGDVDFARKLLLGTRNDTTCWTGAVGPRKSVAWSAPLPLADVKRVARANDATVNDVLVTCVAGTLRAYLEKHHAVCASVNWMIPVNLKALDATLPAELGNSFAIVQLELPTNIDDHLAVLEVVRHRMSRIKNGHEAPVAFRIQALLSGLSRTAYHASVSLLADRAIGVLTNVPGPPTAVYAAGQKVEGMMGWAPLSGNQPMSFTIYSYDGKVFVGIACDAGLVADHEQIVDGFADAFHRLSVVSS